MADTNKKITDASTITSMAGTDKVFVNSGGDLKQMELDKMVAASAPVQTLNSNLGIYKLVNNTKVEIIFTTYQTSAIILAGKYLILYSNGYATVCGEKESAVAFSLSSDYKTIIIENNSVDSRNIMCISKDSFRIVAISA